MTGDPLVRELRDADIAAATTFLESHLETSLFLLAGLLEYGPSMTEHPMSGNFGVIEDDGGVVGVFSLTRKGDLLAQTAGRPELAGLILDAVATDAVKITGVIAEWRIGDSLWRAIQAEPDFRTVYECRSVVYVRQGIDEAHYESDDAGWLRPLTASDFDIWDELDRAFHAEEGLAVLPDEGRRRRMFETRASTGGWWGAFEDGRLVSIACLNAVYRATGQVGGVYTRVSHRRRGLARRVMAALMRHHAENGGMTATVLFAAETNGPARALYDGMGFQVRGSFGLLFGRRES